MFDNIYNLYTQILSLDLSIDRKYHYERLVYLAIHKILFNQIELINARDYSPRTLIIPLECLCALNKVMMHKYQSCNDVIVSEIEKQQHELLCKLNYYNILHMNTIDNQTDILLTNYIYTINLHSIKTRLIGGAIDITMIFVNILSTVSLNPIQFGCLLWFIDSVMYDMMNTVILTSDKSNMEISIIEQKNNKLVSEFVANRNIIYECLEEDSYLGDMKTNVAEYFDIRKNVASQYKINDAYMDFETWYQRKVLFLTRVIKKSMFLTWIYTDLKVICNQFVIALIAYNNINNKIKLLRVDEQTEHITSELPLQIQIDVQLISNGILFYIPKLDCVFNGKSLFNCEQPLQIPSEKWIMLRGESGSGKTTFCNILLKTMPNTVNVLFLNKYDNYDYNSIRNLISNVKPNSDLFDRSIDFNLRFGVKDKSSEFMNKNIHKYLRLFGLHNVIHRLNNKIDDLSTGEKQRIKIIRCILQDKPIWVLDEITANLDPECEETVMTILRQIQQEKKKSVIHISHNSDLIKYSDYRIMIENARITISS
jgi:ABC-type multidrug transport system fused ATPase/permease subunit